MMIKLAGFVLCSSLCLSVAAAASSDYYWWKYTHHPYQTYYLEDYCGPAEKTECTSEAHTAYLNSSGSGSAVVIRGFRASKPTITKNLKCCITIKTVRENRLNVELDDIFLKQKRLGERCDNFLRFRGLEEELSHICSEVDNHSFTAPNNVLEIEYVLSSENVPDFQKIKVVVTSAADLNKVQSGRCSKERGLWQCDDRSCIWEGFRCDAHNNCGDWSDELDCGFFARYWTILLGIFCGIFVGLLIWCVCRCCCCCCCCCWKKADTVKVHMPFVYVTNLGPNGRPVPQDKLYPSLEVPYQNHYAPVQQRGVPPPYNETAHLSPAHNPTYGTNVKS